MMTVERKIEVANNFIKTLNIVDEDVKQEMYLIALEFSPCEECEVEKQESCLNEKLKRRYIKSIIHEAEEEERFEHRGFFHHRIDDDMIEDIIASIFGV